jgi:hypothetical protein
MTHEKAFLPGGTRRIKVDWIISSLFSPWTIFHGGNKLETHFITPSTGCSASMNEFCSFTKEEKIWKSIFVQNQEEWKRMGGERATEGLK